MASMSAKNALRRKIVQYLFELGIFCVPINTMGVAREGKMTTAPKVGVSDMLAWVAPFGRGLAIEIKIGKDRISKEQFGFIKNIQTMGGEGIIATDFNQFIQEYNKIVKKWEQQRLNLS